MPIRCSGASAGERRPGRENAVHLAADKDNMEKVDTLYNRIAVLLGEKNVGLLREYTGRLFAQFNADSEWFYRKGMENAKRADPHG